MTINKHKGENMNDKKAEIIVGLWIPEINYSPDRKHYLGYIWHEILIDGKREDSMQTGLFQDGERLARHGHFLYLAKKMASIMKAKGINAYQIMNGDDKSLKAFDDEDIGVFKETLDDKLK